MKKTYIVIFLSLMSLSIQLKAQYLVPDYVLNYNTQEPTVYSTDLSGGMMTVLDTIERDAIEIAKREIGMLVSYNDGSSWVTKRFEGPDSTNTEWEDWTNWSLIGGGTVAGLEGLNWDNTDDQFWTTGNSVTGHKGTSVSGVGNSVTDYGQLVCGVYNSPTGNIDNAIDQSNILFLVGNGTSGGSLSNAFAVRQDGDVIIYDTLFLEGLLSPTTFGHIYMDSASGALRVDSLPESPSYAFEWKLGSAIGRLKDQRNGEKNWPLMINGQVVDRYYLLESSPNEQIVQLMVESEIQLRLIARLEKFCILMTAVILILITTLIISKRS